jgi:hypothetical protein
MTFYRVTATESGASTIVPPTRGWTSLAAGCCTVLGLTPAELADRVLLPNEYEVPELNLDLDPAHLVTIESFESHRCEGRRRRRPVG